LAAEPAVVHPASPLCQRWRDGAHSWRHRSEGGFDSSHYDVVETPEADARGFVVAHHYARTYPAATQRYGLYRGPSLVGVVVLGVPMQARVLTNVFPDLVPYDESLELSRLVLLDEVPANAETWFLAHAFRLAARCGVRGVVSFSDPVPRRVEGRTVFAGHVGIVYQAKGAVFCGRSSPATKVLLRDGTVLDNRALSKVRGGEQGHAYVERRLVVAGARPPRAGRSGRDWLAQALDEAGATRLRHRGNYRYAFALGRSRDERRHVRIATLAQPYPKSLDDAA
jgi:hypothetical protein